jgi:O-antigen/teichoic acid export membrane protein
MPHNNFISAMFWGQIGRIGEIALSLLFIVLVVRWVPETTFGAYNTVVNLLNLCSALFGLGLSEGLMRYIPVARAADPQAPFDLFHRLQLYNLLSTLTPALLLLAGAGLLAGVLDSPGLAGYWWLPPLLLFIFNLTDVTGTFFMASFWVGRIVLVRLIGQLANILLLSFWMIYTTPSTEILLFSLLVVYSGMLVVSVGLLVRAGLFKAGYAFIDSKKTEITRYCLDLWLNNLANIGLLGQIDVVLLALLATGVEEVSYYSLAALLVMRLYLLVTAWSGSLGSIVATVYLEQGHVGLEIYFARYYRFSLFFHIVPFVALGVLSQPLVYLVFGEHYTPVAALLKLFVLYHMLTALLGGSICPAFITTLGRQKYMMRWRWVFSILNILLDIILIQFWGALGAVLATVLANSMARLIEFWLLRDLLTDIQLLYPLKVLLGVISGGLLALLPGDNSWFGLIWRGVIFGLYLLIFFALVKPLTPEDRLILAQSQPRLARWLRFF